MLKIKDTTEKRRFALRVGKVGIADDMNENVQKEATLSARKRASHFEFLSDKEITRIEEAIQSG